MKSVAKKYVRISNLMSVDEVRVQITADANVFPAVAFFIIATKGCSYMIRIKKILSVGASSACDKRIHH